MAAKTNYFKQNIDRLGEDFIALTPPEQIQGQAKRIVKELVKGDIELEKFGQYFLDLKFLDNLIIGIKNELDEQSLYSVAVSEYRINHPDIPNIGYRENHLQVLCYIYSVVLAKLQAIKCDRNIGYLSDTSALLYNYRSHLR